MLSSILSNATLTIGSLALLTLVSIALGIIIAFVHKITSKYTKNFLITLAVLPTLVMAVMLMVNGNLGTSIAIVGAFSLVRFRSIAGTSKEITSVFFAMAIGLATGMGHLIFAIIMTITISLVLIILDKVKFADHQQNMRILKVTIPENLDYSNIFDDIFTKYTKSVKLENVKTTNMGSLFELTYNIYIKDKVNEKALIDEVRQRNGNLKILLSHCIDDNFL